MLAAIRLNHQSAFQAHEVDNEWTDWTLAPDFKSLQTAVAQHEPKSALCFSRISAERLRPSVRHSLTRLATLSTLSRQAGEGNLSGYPFRLITTTVTNSASTIAKKTARTSTPSQ